MEVYISLLVLVLIFAMFFKGKMYTIIISMILFLVSAFRDVNIGTDLPTYLNRFKIISNTNWSDLNLLNKRWGFEYGYLYFNKLLSLVTNNERLLIILSSAIIIFSFACFIYKNSNNIWLSFYLFITLYFYGTSFNTIRIYIAISICLLCIEFIKKNNLLFFLAGVIIASLFHTSALAFMILYPVSKIEINIKYLIFSLNIFILTKLLSFKIINILLSIFGYNQYISDIGKGDGRGMLILLITVLMGGLILRKTESIVDENFNLWVHMLVIAIEFTILSQSLWIAARVMTYFRVVLIIIIPVLITNIKSKELKFILRMGVITLSLVYFFLVSRPDNAGIIPYKIMGFL